MAGRTSLSSRTASGQPSSGLCASSALDEEVRRLTGLELRQPSRDLAEAMAAVVSSVPSEANVVLLRPGGCRRFQAVISFNLKGAEAESEDPAEALCQALCRFLSKVARKVPTS